jgi:hypothetical protein
MRWGITSDSDTPDDWVLRLWKEAEEQRRIFRERVGKELELLKRRGQLRISIEDAMSEIETGFILAASARDQYRQHLTGQRSWEHFVRTGRRPTRPAARRRISARAAPGRTRRQIDEHQLRFATHMFMLEKLRRRNIGVEKSVELAASAEFSALSPQDRRAVERLALELRKQERAPRGRWSTPYEYWIGQLCQVLKQTTGSKVAFSRSDTGPGGPFFRIIRAAVDYFWVVDDRKSPLKDETIAAYIARRRPQS